MRQLYADLALPYIPRLLQLIDRNQYSRTYGCFDREYWHYRTSDFPCGMSQEFVLPLALVYARQYPGNRFYQVERVRELAEAGVRFMITGSHTDGTCDDYFPFERAMGALVFSLYAGSEAYRLIGMKDERVLDFFLRRVRHLSRRNETGRLTNHQALAALAAYNVYLVTGEDLCRRVSDDRADLALSWQDAEEGWFQEYEGADPGYHTCTIDFLAKLQQKRGDAAFVSPLIKAVEFAWHFMHPDGSYGGEYGSRNTFHFYPHGFELMAGHTPKAGQIADSFLRGAACDKRYHNDDDRMTAHYVYDFLQAFDDYHEQRPPALNQSRAERAMVSFPNARMVVFWTGADQGNLYAAANLAKGGVIKVFDPQGPVASDTGLIGETSGGEVLVSHLMQQDNAVSVDVENGRAVVEGFLCKRRAKIATPLTNICFRMLTTTLGRFFPNVLRSVLQRILITGKSRTGYRFKRTIHLDGDAFLVEDGIDGSAAFKRLGCGSDATSIYVANSDVYQESVLCRWQHAEVATLPQEGGWRLWTRRYRRGSGHSLRD